MYIKRLQVENVKLLRSVEVSFMDGNQPRMWTVFVGENGLCKTSLLQAIALAANGRDRSNQLADVPSLPDRRSEDVTAKISASFAFGPRDHQKRLYPNHQTAALPNIFSYVKVLPGALTVDASSRYEFEEPQPEDLSVNAWKRLGLAIERVRTARGLSHAALAKEVATTEESIRRLESGTFRQDEFSILTRIASRLKPSKKEAVLEPKSSADLELMMESALFDRFDTIVSSAPEESSNTTGISRMRFVSGALAGYFYSVDQIKIAISGRDPLNEARAQALPHWFVAGYGVHRALPAPMSSDTPKDRILARVQSLFGRGGLSGTNFANILPKELAQGFVKAALSR